MKNSKYESKIDNIFQKKISDLAENTETDKNRHTTPPYNSYYPRRRPANATLNRYLQHQQHSSEGIIAEHVAPAIGVVHRGYGCRCRESHRGNGNLGATRGRLGDRAIAVSARVAIKIEILFAVCGIATLSDSCQVYCGALTSC